MKNYDYIFGYFVSKRMRLDNLIIVFVCFGLQLLERYKSDEF